MIRFASYPITRTFTSICIALLACAAPAALDAASPEQLAMMTFQDPTGQTVTLQSLKGKPLLINMWATWCAPCVLELPTLAAIQKEYQKDGLMVITISEDENPAQADKFLKTHNLQGLQAYFDKDHSAMSTIKARGLPTTLLIDRNGKQTRFVEGPVSDPKINIQSLIDQLVAIPDKLPI